MSSKTSLRLSGSPPVKTKIGTCIAAIWSIRSLHSALDSSSGWAMGCAAARQCLQARSQDCVTSQIARKGVSSKFNPPRAGIVCIGCMEPPAGFGPAGVEIIGPGGENCGSIPEKQARCWVGCDLDHVICPCYLSPLDRYSPLDKSGREIGRASCRERV